MNRTVVRERISPGLNCKRVTSRLTKSVVFVGGLVINVIPMADTAAAHDRWFTVCNFSDDSLPIGKVLTTTFFLLGALFLTLFYIACKAEQTAFGAAFSRLLDRCAEPLHRRRDVLVRAVAALSFALLWADGGLIQTPELNANVSWLSIILLLVPAYQFTRATLPAAGVGILVLCGYGAATCGPFHMLDYPVFVGLGVFFALSVVQTARLLTFRFDVLRWSVALSLLWPSMEIFVYPAWVAPIAIAHPELTLGFDVDTVVTAAGVVEFGLAFALLWTPLIRRLAALVLALLFIAATFEFGRVEGIGRLLIFAILLLVFADPGRKQPRCRPVLAPLVGSATWLATVFLYTGAHALNHGSRNQALVALAGGAAALGFIFFCLLNRTRTAVRRASPASAATIWSDVALGRQHGGRSARFVGEVFPNATDRDRAGSLGRAFSARART